MPKLFLKPSSAITGPDAPLCLPSISSTTDWEVELAVARIEKLGVLRTSVQ